MTRRRSTLAAVLRLLADRLDPPPAWPAFQPPGVALAALWAEHEAEKNTPIPPPIRRLLALPKFLRRQRNTKGHKL